MHAWPYNMHMHLWPYNVCVYMHAWPYNKYAHACVALQCACGMHACSDTF